MTSRTLLGSWVWLGATEGASRRLLGREDSFKGDPKFSGRRLSPEPCCD